MRKHDDYNIYSFIDEIRLRPGMWLTAFPDRSVICVQDMLAGYTCALRRHQIQENELAPFWVFSDWIGWRLNRPASYPWSKNILDDSEEELQAFFRYFVLVDEYRQRRWETVASVQVNHDRPRPVPLEVRLIQLFPDPVFFFHFTYRRGEEYVRAQGDSIENNQWIINARFKLRSEVWCRP